MHRRSFLLTSAAAGIIAGSNIAHAQSSESAFDVAVVGAGVFGAWTAWSLFNAGLNVALIDKRGPANSLASSGGESRVTRSGYGDNDIYAEWAFKSLDAWAKLSASASLPLFHPMGVLWVHPDGDDYADASARSLSRLAIPHETLLAREVRQRYPVLTVKDGEAGLLEPRHGALMARRAVQTLVHRAVEGGMTFLRGDVAPVSTEQADGTSLTRLDLTTPEGTKVIRADRIVLAAGPWLDQVAPEAMAGRLFVTRQEVFYFNAGRDITGNLPVWAALPFYGFPDIEGRGFKIANDTHGPRVNPDSQSRLASDNEIERARTFLADRFPALADAAITETRVCQYENSANGDLIIDTHPGLDNVWVVGGGSGHGFKHGPALGAHVAALVQGNERLIPRFSLASKGTRQNREIE